jgi:hypothetical protein
MLQIIGVAAARCDYIFSTTYCDLLTLAAAIIYAWHYTVGAATTVASGMSGAFHHPYALLYRI